MLIHPMPVLNRQMRLLLHPNKHTTKQECNTNTPTITNEIARYKTECSLSELAQAIENGQAFVLATSLTNKRNNASFAESELIGIDIDKAESVEAVLDKAHKAGLEPAIGYYTMSQQNYDKPNPPDSPKPGWNFRLIFKLEEPITDADLYKEVVAGLVKKLGSDEACKDAMRLFYGSKPGSVFLLDEDAENDNTTLYMMANEARKTNKQYYKRADYDSLDELPLAEKQELAMHYKNSLPKLLGEGHRHEKIGKYIYSLWGLGFMNAGLAFEIMDMLVDSNADLYEHYIEDYEQGRYYETAENYITWASKTFH